MSAAIGKNRRARLAIPKVNQNPRVGSARPIVSGRRGLAQNVVAATSTATTATTPAQPGNTVPSTQSAPIDPLAATSGATQPPPSGSFTIPGWTPQSPGEADPRDAAYWSQLAKLKFDDEQKYREVGESQSRSDLDYADATRTALRNRLSQQRGLGESAIRANLGASGWLNRNEAEQTAQYTQDREHASLSKEQEDHARAAAKAALEQGWTIDAAGLLAEAAARYASGAEGQAADGELDAGSSAGNGPTGSATGGRWAFYPTPGSLPMNQKQKQKKGAKGASGALANAVVASGKKKGKAKK